MSQASGKTVVTIAGFDPSSGAGATADLAVIAAHGHFGTACITALTVQSTLGVRTSQAISSELVRATLECLEDDLPADGIKIGMLATAPIVEVVGHFIKLLRSRGRSVPIVLDPVLQSSSGRELLDPEGLLAMRQNLLSLVDWVTPNLSELAILSGLTVRSKEEMQAGANKLREHYPSLGVVVKGGHLSETADDLVLTPQGDATWLEGDRIVSQATHGTGCAFSSAMVCELIAGHLAIEAAQRAKKYVRYAIQHAEPLGKGYGPTNLYWPMRHVPS